MGAKLKTVKTGERGKGSASERLLTAIVPVAAGFREKREGRGARFSRERAALTAVSGTWRREALTIHSRVLDLRAG